MFKLLKNKKRQSLLADSNASQRGFSIVEVLVALTLFGFLISGIITFVTAGLDVTQKTETQLALHLGENQQELQLENLLVHPVTRIDTGTPSIVSTTTGAIFEIDDSTTFIGTQSMTGICS